MIAKNRTTGPDNFQARGVVGKRVAAAFLGVTTRTVENLQRQGMPFYRISSRRNGYLIDEIKDWLMRSRRGDLNL